MEADLARYYQIDIADLYRDRLSLRRLLVLLRYLPGEAWVARIEAAAEEEAAAQARATEVEDTLAPFQR